MTAIQNFIFLWLPISSVKMESSHCRLEGHCATVWHLQLWSSRLYSFIKIILDKITFICTSFSLLLRDSNTAFRMFFFQGDCIAIAKQIWFESWNVAVKKVDKRKLNKMKIRQIQNLPYQKSTLKKLQVKHNELQSQNYRQFSVITFVHCMLFTKKNEHITILLVGRVLFHA